MTARVWDGLKSAMEVAETQGLFESPEKPIVRGSRDDPDGHDMQPEWESDDE